MNSRGRQLSFYAAAVFFQSRQRLTGFGRARKIVRIQTNCPNRTDVNYRHRPDCVTVHLRQLRRSTV
jgi:hypothetical protein